MDVLELVHSAERDGVRIEVVDGELQIEAKESRRHWLEKLRPHKAAILAHLNGEAYEASEAPGDNEDQIGSRYIPFPLHTLPRVVAAFVAAAGAAIGCDTSYIALPLLACLARAVGNKRVIRLKDGWEEPAVIWGAIVGKSGTHKTPAMQVAMQFLQRRQAQSVSAHSAALAAYEQEKALYERDYLAWKRSKSVEPPPVAPEEPACERYLTTDCTIEALAALLGSQFDGVLVSRDELAGWFGGIAEYKGGKGSDLGHWLAMWSATSLIVDRKTGPTKMLHIARAAVSLIGGIQPSVLRSAIGREHMQDGLCARVLLAMPEPRVVRWSEATIGAEIEAELSGVFDRLFSLEPAINADGVPEPICLDLTPEAKALWVEYFNRHRAELAEVSDDLRAAGTKLEAYAARFALIFQLCAWAAGDAECGAIDETAMRAGIELADWFGGEANRVYGTFAESPEETEVREVIETIQLKGGAITVRELMRCCRRFRRAAEAEAFLQGLATVGKGRWVQISPGASGGKPTRRFILAGVADVDET